MSVYWSNKYHKDCKKKKRSFDKDTWLNNGCKCPVCGENITEDDMEEDG